MIEKKEGFVGQQSYVVPSDLLTRISKHPLLEALHITDIGYYPKASFHARERKSGCPQYILIYCVQGEGYFEINESRYEIIPDYFFILPAHIPHKYGANSDNPWTIYWVHFTGTKASDYWNFLLDNSDTVMPIFLAPNNDRIVIFEDIMTHIEMSFNDDNMVYANTRFAYFLTTFKSSVFSPNSQRIDDPDSISRVINYMREHLTEMLTLEQLAEVAGMSTSHFSAVFRQKVQSSPIQFFTVLKIQQACRLLEYSTLRIKEIAYQIGYSDPYHFSRVFTTVMGISPRDFRKADKQ